MNRREFLRGLMTTAAAVSLPSPGQPATILGLDLAAPGGDACAVTICEYQRHTITMIAEAFQVPERMLRGEFAVGGEHATRMFYEAVANYQRETIREVLMNAGAFQMRAVHSHEFDEMFSSREEVERLD